MTFQSFIAEDGARIAYRDEGEGRPLLLLHGLNAHGGFFAPQAHALQDRFRIIRPDFRGHGRTAATPAPDIARLAQDMAQLIQHLGLEKIVGVGWSMGAMVLWELLNGPATAAFAGMVVIDMSPRLLAEPGWSLGLIDRAMREPPARETALERGRRIAGLIFAERGARRPMLIERWGAELGKADPDAVMALGASLYAQDYRAALGSITVPTLVAHGAASRFYPAQTSRFIADRVARGRMETFPQSGHAPHLEEAERFTKSLAAFARGCLQI